MTEKLRRAGGARIGAGSSTTRGGRAKQVPRAGVVPRARPPLVLRDRRGAAVETVRATRDVATS